MGYAFLRLTAKCSCLESLFVLLIYVYVLFLSVAKLGARPFRVGIRIELDWIGVANGVGDTGHTTPPLPNSSCA